MIKKQSNNKRRAYADYVEDFTDHLIKFRRLMGVSCRAMSLTIERSESYINKVEKGKTLPSMQNFFYICYYLDVTPEEFFTCFSESSKEQRFFDNFTRLSEQQQKHLLLFIEDLPKKQQRQK